MRITKLVPSLCALTAIACGSANEPTPDEHIVESAAEVTEPPQAEPTTETPSTAEGAASPTTQWYWAEMVIQTTQTSDGPVYKLVPRNSAEESNIRFFAVEGFSSELWFDISSDASRVSVSGAPFAGNPVAYVEREYRLEHNCEGEWQTLAELDTHSQQVGDSPQLAALMSRFIDWDCAARWGIEMQPNEHLGENGQPASRTF